MADRFHFLREKQKDDTLIFCHNEINSKTNNNLLHAINMDEFWDIQMNTEHHKDVCKKVLFFTKKLSFLLTFHLSFLLHSVPG